MPSAERPFVTVAMPALNEERHIARALLSLTQGATGFDYELLVLDGGSTDYTAAIVDVFARANPRIRLVANERRIQSAGVNKAAGLADKRARYLVRADCHADYPPNFIESCIGALERSGAVSVVVQMQTVGATCFQKAVATAQNSRLGNGGSAHRTAGVSRYVEHGHHAAFRIDAFRDSGGYDETFTHNEDAELDVRLVRAGGRIWLNADAVIAYFPRSTIPALARQYFMHGRGRARTIRKHRLAPKIRQVLPLVAVTVALLGLLGSFADVRLSIVPAAYISAALIAGALLAVRRASPCAVASGLAALIMHTSWAIGFAAAFSTRRKPDRPAIAEGRPVLHPAGSPPSYSGGG